MVPKVLLGTLSTYFMFIATLWQGLRIPRTRTYTEDRWVTELRFKIKQIHFPKTTSFPSSSRDVETRRETVPMQGRCKAMPEAGREVKKGKEL